MYWRIVNVFTETNQAHRFGGCFYQNLLVRVFDGCFCFYCDFVYRKVLTKHSTGDPSMDPVVRAWISGECHSFSMFLLFANGNKFTKHFALQRIDQTYWFVWCYEESFRCSPRSLLHVVCGIHLSIESSSLSIVCVLCVCMWKPQLLLLVLNKFDSLQISTTRANNKHSIAHDRSEYIFKK